jgi:hypothetical protein
MLFATRLTRQVTHVEQELLALLELPSWPPVFSGVRVARSLVFSLHNVFFLNHLFLLSFFIILAIVLSVYLQFMASDYPFGVFKLFMLLIVKFKKNIIKNVSSTDIKLVNVTNVSRIISISTWRFQVDIWKLNKQASEIC